MDVNNIDTSKMPLSEILRIMNGVGDIHPFRTLKFKNGVQDMQEDLNGGVWAYSDITDEIIKSLGNYSLVYDDMLPETDRTDGYTAYPIAISISVGGLRICFDDNELIRRYMKPDNDSDEDYILVCLPEDNEYGNASVKIFRDRIEYSDESLKEVG